MLDKLIVLALVALAELAMAYFWFPPYYSIGLPLFYRVLRAPSRPSALPVPDSIRTSFSSLDRAVSLASLGDGLFAFREDSGRGTSPHYSQLLHGSLTFDPREGTLTIVGLVNYFPVAVVAALAAWGWTAGFPWIAALPVVIFIPIYIVQRDVYLAVGEAALRAWTSTEANATA